MKHSTRKLTSMVSSGLSDITNYFFITEFWDNCSMNSWDQYVQ